MKLKLPHYEIRRLEALASLGDEHLKIRNAAPPS
jgi:hypothetical protein